MPALTNSLSKRTSITRNFIPRRLVTASMYIVASALISLPCFAEKESETFSGADIVKHCAVKNPGKDQLSTFTVLLNDRDGSQKRYVYTRAWKDSGGVDGFADKMLLITTDAPLGAKGAVFMRFAYLPEEQKYADQWISWPKMEKIRRVTIRSPGDSFLSSELTHADVSPRLLSQDTHTYKEKLTIKGQDFYVVESVPKEENPLYSKRVQYFQGVPDWQNCSHVRTDYYDTKGVLLKEQFIKWQRVGDAWIWDRVLVRDRQKQKSSIFVISDVKVNLGLDDEIFSERTLKGGLDYLQRQLKAIKKDKVKK
ncbi:MAG: outer membrane lipoprotein-sorting protein [Gammaproteobacteria bacterium]